MLPIDWKPDDHKLRQFGFIAVLGFVLLSAIVYGKTAVLLGGPGPIALGIISLFLSLALICPVLAIIRPALLQPIWVGMMILAAPIGFVVGHVVVVVVFYIVVTPIALFFRFTGRDALQRAITSPPSYWEQRPPTPPPASYYRQF